MKKYFLSIVALAGMLFATSCQESLVEPQVGGTTTFTIQVPDAMGTKAIGEAVNTNKLYVQVYNADFDGQCIYSVQEEMENGKFEVSLTLIQDQTYGIIFWAQNDNSKYDVDDLRNIDLNIEHHNSELGAAFYHTMIFTPDGQGRDITLRRPFAQLNLGTSAESLDTDVLASNIELGTSKVIVTGIASSFNTVTGKGESSGTYTYETNYANVLAYTTDKLNVANVDYHYISMDYLPVVDNESLVTVQAYVTTNAGDIEHSFTNVPVKKNYRTNIVGNLISSTTDFNVTIDPNWDGEYNDVFDNCVEVEDRDDLQSALDEVVEGESTIIYLTEDIQGDIVISEKEVDGKEADVIIDGAGHTFSGQMKINGHSEQGNSSLIIRNINFVTSVKDHYFIYADKDNATRYANNVTVQNCTFTAIAGSDAVHTAVGVHVTQAFGITIDGCVATRLHSLLQAQSIDSWIKVENSQILETKGGVAFGNTKQASVKNLTIESNISGEYGIRVDGTDARECSLTIENIEVEAYYPVFVRYLNSTSQKYSVVVNGENSLDCNGTNPYQVIFSQNKDGQELVAPEDGKYSISGTDDSELIIFPKAVTVNNEEELEKAFEQYASQIKLESDILLTDPWTPIGTADVPYAGVIDGNGKKISGLKVDGVEYAAFISHTAPNTIIKNLTLEDVNLNSTKHAAGVVCVAGENLTLENIIVSGTINATSYAGGIVHNAANVTIKNCINNANVTANRAGGIASWVTVGANIENVKNYGNITGGVGASGIAHGFAGSIKNAKNYGNITSNNLEAAAGIAGVQKAASTYEYCYNYGEVKSTFDDANASAAGILGQSAGSSSTLNYCANYGDVTAEKSYAAGIAYSLYGSIKANYCYNKGNISGADGAGAIAPKAQYGTGDKANCCLNSGIITSQNGVVYQGSNNNTSCYYYNDTELYDVKNNSLVSSQDVINVLNGGADNDFFSLDTNGIIVVVAE